MTFPNLIIELAEKIKSGAKSPTFIKVIRSATVVIMVMHFSILALHQLPDNPLQHQYKRELTAYVEPFFSQAWTLFSPNPINTNMSLLMRFEFEDKVPSDTTEWIDITEPLIKVREASFWSPAQRISKFTQTCMTNISESHKKIMKHIEETDSLKNDASKAGEFYRHAMAGSFGYRSLVQYSQHVARNYFAQQRKTPKEVKLQYKILNAKFPRFSRRTLDYYDLDNYEFTELSSQFININL
jgi:hypothetical protein